MTTTLPIGDPVVIEDVSNWVPELVAESAEIDEEGDPL